MKQEFITVRGKLFINDDKLVIRNYKLKTRSDAYRLSILALLCLNSIAMGSRLAPLSYILLGLIGFIFFISVVWYLIIYTWKNQFPLQDIISYRVINDDVGLETTVCLKLRSGKQKEIQFRTHEGQLEPFLELIAQHCIQTQFI